MAQSNVLCAVLGILSVVTNISYAFALESRIVGYKASKPSEIGDSDKWENALPVNFFIKFIISSVG
jgi:hypothetical protein